MDITLKILSVCPSGEHIQIEATIDGGAKKALTIMRQQLTRPLADISPEEALGVILRNHIKEQGLTTTNQIRTYIEGHTFKW